jgi:hypothetical protein
MSCAQLVRFALDMKMACPAIVNQHCILKTFGKVCFYGYGFFIFLKTQQRPITCFAKSKTNYFYRLPLCLFRQCQQLFRSKPF